MSPSFTSYHRSQRKAFPLPLKTRTTSSETAWTWGSKDWPGLRRAEWVLSIRAPIPGQTRRRRVPLGLLNGLLLSSFELAHGQVLFQRLSPGAFSFIAR